MVQDYPVKLKKSTEIGCATPKYRLFEVSLDYDSIKLSKMRIIDKYFVGSWIQHGNLKGGGLTSYSTKFSRKLHENEENWAGGEGQV